MASSNEQVRAYERLAAQARENKRLFDEQVERLKAFEAKVYDHKLSIIDLQLGLQEIADPGTSWLGENCDKYKSYMQMQFKARYGMFYDQTDNIWFAANQKRKMLERQSTACQELAVFYTNQAVTAASQPGL
ncbi:MAG: DUF5082 domain-containing protein [Coriobacteriia bacterium]|nr:DUF5082 domain-containing protein [Coriobacteriia bacterium]